MASWAQPARENGYHQEHAILVLSSFARWTGRALLANAPAPAEQAAGLFHAPFAVVSHDTQRDPIFNYGNRTALELFGYSWAEFTALPSRLSAEPLHRDERARLLELVSLQGCYMDYRGVRIGRSGRRFRIEGAAVWNLLDEHGAPYGQAAMFDSWVFLP